MATYSTKYRITVYSLSGIKRQLLLKKKGYTGSIIDLYGGDSPLILSDPNTDNGKLQVIRGTELDANLVVNMDSASYTFKQDFWEINDREWQAELQQPDDADIHTGTCEITNFVIDNASAPASAWIRVDAVPGSLEYEPTCICHFDFTQGPNKAINKAYFYAVPPGEPVTSYQAFLIGWVDVDDLDDAQAISDKMANKYPDVEKYLVDTGGPPGIIAQGIIHTQTAYHPQLNTGWEIKTDVDRGDGAVIDPFNILSPHYYSGATERGFLKLQWMEEDKNEPINLATHWWSSGGTEAEAIIDMRNQINGDQGYFYLQGIYFPSDAQRHDIKIVAEIDSGDATKLNLYLTEIGALGNDVDIDSQELMDTLYLRCFHFGSYSFARAGSFTGGNSDGDDYNVKIDKGSGYLTMIPGHTSVIAGDTAVDVVSKLINNINTYSPLTAELDVDNNKKFHIYTTDPEAGSWEYMFDTTSISSSVTPSAYTSFEIKGVSSMFYGWVIPGEYSQPHLPGYVKVSLKAVCGLGDLKNITYEYNDKRPFQVHDLITIVSTALRQTGLNLKLYEAFDLWESHTDITKPALQQIYEETSRLNNKSSYETLKELIKLLRAYITQRNGRWEIVPIEQQSQTYTYNVYGSTGAHIGTENRENHIKKVGKGQDNIFAKANQRISFDPAFKEVVTEQDYGFIPQLLKFPNFSLLNENLDVSSYNRTFPWKWRLDGTNLANHLGKIYRREDGYLKMEDAEGQQERYYLAQDFKMSWLPSEGLTYKIEVTYKGQKDKDSAADNFSFQLKLYYLDTGASPISDWWLRNLDNVVDESSSSELGTFDFWDYSETFITVDNKVSSADETWSQEFNMPTTGTADAVFRLYQPAGGSGFILIKSVKIIALTTAPAKGRKKSYFQDVDTYGVSLHDKISSEKLKEEFTIGDVPQVHGPYMLIYKNALYYKARNSGDFLITGTWYNPKVSDSQEKTLVTWYREFALRQYAVTPVSLEAQIMGTVGLRDIIEDVADSNRKYMLTGGDRSLRTGIVSGQWTQINLEDDYTNFPTDLITKQLQSDEQSSGGSESYGGGGGTVDLSNYLTESEIRNLISGRPGVFYGSDLDANRQIVVSHTLAREPLLFSLYKEGVYVDLSNYTMDTEGSVERIKLTVNVPYTSATKFIFRML